MVSGVIDRLGGPLPLRSVQLLVPGSGYVGMQEQTNGPVCQVASMAGGEQ
jgi:hypothetical protein